MNECYNTFLREHAFGYEYDCILLRVTYLKWLILKDTMQSKRGKKAFKMFYPVNLNYTVYLFDKKIP